MFKSIKKYFLLKRKIKQAAKDGVTTLNLSNEEITKLPPEIGQLTQLTSLNLWGDQLTALPPEIGLLVNLKEPGYYSGLKLDNNPLESPPRKIVKQGTKAILAYFQKTSKHQ